MMINFKKLFLLKTEKKIDYQRAIKDIKNEKYMRIKK